METASTSGLIERAKAIILKPKETWPVIAGEATTPGQLIKSYALPLAAIGPIATLIGGQVFGYGILGMSYHPSLASGITTAILTLFLSLLSIVMLTLMADGLAPKFGGESNRNQAFKLVAYSFTASWLSAIFGLVPMLSVFGLLGLYSFYLFYAGSGPMMKVPAEKALGYTAVTAICTLLLLLVVSLAVSTLSSTFSPASLTGSAMSGAGEVSDR
jgi:hypothetical protein